MSSLAQQGTTYCFGALNAPDVLGIKVRMATVKRMPQGFWEEKGQYDEVECIARSTRKKYSISLWGFVPPGFDVTTVADNFTFKIPNGSVGGSVTYGTQIQFFVSGDISNPVEFGKYWRVSVEGTGYSNITTTSDSTIST